MQERQVDYKRTVLSEDATGQRSLNQRRRVKNQRHEKLANIRRRPSAASGFNTLQVPANSTGLGYVRSLMASITDLNAYFQNESCEPILTLFYEIVTFEEGKIADFIFDSEAGKKYQTKPPYLFERLEIVERTVQIFATCQNIDTLIKSSAILQTICSHENTDRYVDTVIKSGYLQAANEHLMVGETRGYKAIEQIIDTLYNISLGSRVTYRDAIFQMGTMQTLQVLFDRVSNLSNNSITEDQAYFRDSVIGRTFALYATVHLQKPPLPGQYFLPIWRHVCALLDSLEPTEDLTKLQRATYKQCLNVVYSATNFQKHATSNETLNFPYVRCIIEEPGLIARLVRTCSNQNSNPDILFTSLQILSALTLDYETHQVLLQHKVVELFVLMLQKISFMHADNCSYHIELLAALYNFAYSAIAAPALLQSDLILTLNVLHRNIQISSVQEHIYTISLGLLRTIPLLGGDYEQNQAYSRLLNNNIIGLMNGALRFPQTYLHLKTLELLKTLFLWDTKSVSVIVENNDSIMERLESFTLCTRSDLADLATEILDTFMCSNHEAEFMEMEEDENNQVLFSF